MKVIIIGAGIGGLVAGLIASERGNEVVIVSKNKNSFNTASSWAQGGISYTGKNDSPEKLKDDIINASGGMSNMKVVDYFTKHAPTILKEILVDKVKVPFEIKDGEFIFTKEAAHSCKRILFSGDNTGEVIIEKILDYMRGLKNITFLWSHMAIDLINIPHHSIDPLAVYGETRCVGVYLYDILNKVVVKDFSDKIILATGGVGQIYKHTTNPPSATGDGIAIAYRAGARIINMEYTQFHPTSLSIKGSKNFLISEALRGEGAIITNDKGEDFMKKYDSRGSLSSRDVVVRGIVDELSQSKNEHIYLSLKNCSFDFKSRFPIIYQKCIDYALDVNSPHFKGIPITPAFHYLCGGVFTNLNSETTIKNLFAVGEVACTGLHGANRLASTSLLEGLFFAHQAASAEVNDDDNFDVNSIREWSSEEATLHEVDPVMIKQDFESLKTIMWNYVGITRKKTYLSSALTELSFLKNRIENRYRKSKLTQEIMELRNSVQVGMLVASSAIKNKKSIGCHYLID